MRKSIFDIETRIDVDYEFEKLKEVLGENNTLYYNGESYSLYKYLNDEILPIWEYKGIFIDFDDYFYSITNTKLMNISSHLFFSYLIN